MDMDRPLKPNDLKVGEKRPHMTKPSRRMKIRFDNGKRQTSARPRRARVAPLVIDFESGGREARLRSQSTPAEPEREEP
jgi:hypothetical protein